MDDKEFISKVSKRLQASQMVSLLVELRSLYNSFIDIARDETYTEEERKEASELTKDGFHSFVGKARKLQGED